MHVTCRLLVILTFGILTTIVGFASSALAACVGPGMSINPNQGPTRTSVVVLGQGWYSECRDTLGPGQTTAPPLAPATGITIQFVQGARSWDLATVDAGADLRFQTTVAVPDEAVPGAASITASTSQAERLTSSTSFTVTSAELPRTGFGLRWDLLTAAGTSILLGVLLRAGAFRLRHTSKVHST